MNQANEGTGILELSEKMTEVARCCRRKKTGETIYRLFREDIASDSFLICVSTDTASEIGRLTGTLTQASLFFERISQGDVPPYILSEVLEDYAEENGLLFANI